MSEKTIDPMEFRKALGSFVTGVTVVCTRQPDGTPRGFTANSFTSVSLSPALLLVCIGKTASSYPIFSEADIFSVSILAENQKNVSSIFASKAPDKFAQAAWHEATTGAPIVSDSAAWFDCKTHQVVDAGDHIILIGEVVDFDHQPVNPLGYCKGAYVSFSLSQDALASASARVGAILEQHHSIVMIKNDDGNLTLPAGNKLQPETEKSSLLGLLKSLNLTSQLDFLFAVFDDARANGASNIYYRGRLISDLPSDGNLVLIPFQAIDWSLIKDEAVAMMLKRYVKERSEDAFGVYVGDASQGTVQQLARTPI
ncbi:flavin reductase family protein [Leeia sp. TBRC 13508]|uniref:Flavin reductase family protein n=1 Tax=Leeia speluncae TaxID=2884804 RepID=A0ABS8D495_9NEIS|nr:flavin reductase family protein [Leeia speluncae]MCB6183029.1 flavin reductase family protein [Leeia speluncae]